MRDTEASKPLHEALRFLLRVGLWIVVWLGVFRLPWVVGRLLVPFARLQHTMACTLTGLPRDAVSINAGCTAGDAMALCLGAIFAFPVSWRKRLEGAAIGLVVITIVNSIRFASLSAVGGKGKLFQLLHLQVWPAILIVVVAVYVFAWMRLAGGGTEASAALAGRRSAPAGGGGLTRFFLLTAVLVTLYYGYSEAMFTSAPMLAVAGWVARTAGAVMSLMGIAVEVTANHIKVGHIPYRVTQECIATPLIPVYLAAALSLPGSWKRRLTLVLLAGPLFFLLGVGRLLVLALPRFLIRSQNLAIHSFHQVVLGVAVVVLAAWWLHGRGAAANPRWGRRALLAVSVGVGVGLLMGLFWTGSVQALASATQGVWGHAEHVPADAQLALAFLPVFQMALFAALCVVALPPSGWRRALVSVAVLAALQVVTMVALGELAGHGGVVLHVALIRGLAIVVPLALVWWIGRRER